MKGKSTTLDWDAQEKVRSTVEEIVKETSPVIKKLRAEGILPAMEKSVKVAGCLQGQQLEKVQPPTIQRDSPTLDEEEAEPYDLWQDLRKQPLHMTMEQLLALVPNFRRSLVKQLTEPVRARTSETEAVLMGVSLDGACKARSEDRGSCF